jgi:hypothetical protein
MVSSKLLSIIVFLNYRCFPIDYYSPEVTQESQVKLQQMILSSEQSFAGSQWVALMSQNQMRKI